jgi:TPR repeat protein
MTPSVEGKQTMRIFLLPVLVIVLSETAAISTACAQTFRQAEAFWQRGEHYYEAKDYRDAYMNLLQAARMGHPRAQALLAIMYQDGQGMPENDREAAHWFALAAAQGHRASQYELGAMYEEGEGGLPKDVPKAAQLYTLSAKQGFAQAQFALGLSYEFGEGVPRNRQTAIYWLNLAAAQGDGRAHWVADWLRRPGTPHFAKEEQLGAYIGNTIAQYYQHMYSSNGTCNIGCKISAAYAAHDQEVKNQAAFRSYVPPANP